MPKPKILHAYSVTSNTNSLFYNTISTDFSNSDVSQGVFIGYPLGTSIYPNANGPCFGAYPNVVYGDLLPNGVYLTGTLPASPDIPFNYSSIIVIEIGPNENISIICSSQGGGGGGSTLGSSYNNVSPTGGGSGGYTTPITISTTNSFNGIITLSILVGLYNDSIPGLANNNINNLGSSGSQSFITIGVGNIFLNDETFQNLSTLSNLNTINIPYNQPNNYNDFFSVGLGGGICNSNQIAGYAGAFSIQSQITNPPPTPIEPNTYYSITIGQVQLGGAGGWNGSQGSDANGMYSKQSYYQVTYPDNNYDNSINGYMGYTLITPFGPYQIGSGGAAGGDPGGLANPGGGSGGGSGNPGNKSYWNGNYANYYACGGGGSSAANNTDYSICQGGGGYPGFCMIYV